MTYGAQRPARRMGGLVLLGSLTGLGEAAVVLLIVALISAHQPARYPLVDRLPSSAWALAGLTLAALALLALAHLGSAVIAARAGAEVQRTVQTRLVAGFLDAPWSAQVGARAGELQELATVKANMLAFGTQEGALALGAALNLLMVIVAAAVLSIWATAALVASVVLVVAFSRPLRNRHRHAMRGAMREASGLATEISETALTARDMRVFGVTGAARQRLVERIDELGRRHQAVRTMTAATPPLTRDATVAVLVVGLVIVVTGTGVALPTLGASMILVLRSLAHAQALSGAALRLQEGEDNLERIEERLRGWRPPSAAGTRPCPRVDRVELRDVSFTYPGAQRPALDGVSLIVARGEQIGIVGPTGAGKSTLASVLLGLVSPDRGSVLVDGIALAEIAPGDWHQRTAWLGQEPRLLTASVAENIRFLRPGFDDETVRAAALAASLGAELARWPDGLDHPTGAAGSALSGGERQRVALARALAGRPDLLVLDEPTSALDAHTEAAVRRALGTLRQDTALAVIAHRLSTVRLCDRVAVMQAGRIVDLAPPDELALTDAWFRDALALSTPDGARPPRRADRPPAHALSPAVIRGAREDPPPVRHNLRRAARRAPLAAEAALVLSLASVAVRVLPAPRTTRLLGRLGAPDLPAPHPSPSPSPRARLVGDAVEQVAARLPWHPECLPRAIATRAMLRRRGIASEGHLGVVGTAPLSAHAWVTVGGATVQGGPVEHATEIAVLR